MTNPVLFLHKGNPVTVALIMCYTTELVFRASHCSPGPSVSRLQKRTTNNQFFSLNFYETIPCHYVWHKLYGLSDRHLSVKFSAKFADRGMSHGQRGGSPTVFNLQFSRPEPLLFLSSSSSFILCGHKMASKELVRR
jgi:hypothetical protein